MGAHVIADVVFTPVAGVVLGVLALAVSLLWTATRRDVRRIQERQFVANPVLAADRPRGLSAESPMNVDFARDLIEEGRRARELGSFNEASSLFRQVVAGLQPILARPHKSASESAELLVFALRQEAALATIRKELWPAVGFAQQAKHVCDRYGLDHLLLEVAQCMGHALYVLGNYRSDDRLLVWSADTLKATLRKAPPHLAPSVSVNLATALIWRNNLQEADELLVQNLHHIGYSSQPDGLASILQTRGRLLVRAGNLRDAEKAIMHAFDLSLLPAGDPLRRVICLVDRVRLNVAARSDEVELSAAGAFAEAQRFGARHQLAQLGRALVPVCHSLRSPTLRDLALSYA